MTNWYAIFVGVGWGGVLLECIRPGWVAPGVVGAVLLVYGYARLLPRHAMLAALISAPFHRACRLDVRHRHEGTAQQTCAIVTGAASPRGPRETSCAISGRALPYRLFSRPLASRPRDAAEAEALLPLRSRRGPDELIARGTVVLAEGGAPPRLVRLDRSCGGRVIGSAFADSKGRFSFDLGVLDSEFRRAGANTANFGSVNIISPQLLKGCVIRASFLGYRSAAISLEQVAKKGNANLADITLEPVGKPFAPLMSATDSDVPKNAKRDFDKGFDEAAKSKWPDAIASIEKAASSYRKYAHAWLSLGNATGFEWRWGRGTPLIRAGHCGRR